MTTLTAHPAARAQELLAESVRLGRRIGDVAAVWGAQRIDPKLREEVMLAVAQANDCRLCSMAHREWALAEGVSDAELAALENEDPAGFDRRTWVAIAWAQERARSGDRSVPRELEAELARHYDAAERADLELVADAMTLANHSAGLLEALVARLRGRPVAGSRLADELAVGAVAAAAIPPVAGYLAVARRRRTR